jgi:carbonic anhydrase
MQPFHKATRTKKRRRVEQSPGVESLEPRVALSGTPIKSAAAAALGTIQGRVTNESTGRGIAHVRVQLIDTDGAVVRTAITGAGGRYQFRIRENGAYVVREVAPRRFAQQSPTFLSTGPAGAFTPPFGNGSWNYSTGNSNPANGPVGPYSWDTIAPAGDLPFESPINLTGPTVDLSTVLGIHYGNAVPRQVVNNGHQIQVQFPAGSPADSVTVGGQEFDLTQFHYHDPAETTVNGRASSLEEHFVNVSASGADTVVAVFLQLGAHNAALDPVLDAALASLTRPNSTTTITAPINFAGLLPTNTQGWFYEGSLTTPPLSGPINWFVFATPITLDSQQLSEYESVAAGSGFLPNARPVQPLDGRRLNEIDYDVNFQDQSIAGLNFVLARRPRAGATLS